MARPSRSKIKPGGVGQSTLTDNSGGTASTTLAAISGAYTQSEVRNSIATLARAVNALRDALVTKGIIVGS
jgi:hypothetical protein